MLTVANEDYINEENADQKNRKTYKKFKEKVVWQAIRFHNSFEVIFV